MTLAASMLLRQLSRRSIRAGSALLRPASSNVSIRSMSSAAPSAGTALSVLASQNPHVDVIRYEHKNLKWTLKNVDKNSDALAIGLLDQGFTKGDVVLSWLPDHFAEQVSFYHNVLSQNACKITFPSLSWFVLKMPSNNVEIHSNFCDFFTFLYFSTSFNLHVPKLDLSSTHLTQMLQKKHLLKLLK